VCTYAYQLALQGTALKVLDTDLHGGMTDLDDDDINSPYHPALQGSAAKKLAAVARLPRGSAVICVMTFLITFVAGIALHSVFSATSVVVVPGKRGSVVRNRAVSGRDWDKTANAARQIDRQVNAVQSMEDELSLADSMPDGRGPPGPRRDSRSSGRGAGADLDMPFLDPVQPMQQYAQYQQNRNNYETYKRDYRRQERRRKASRGSGWISAAMQTYIDEAKYLKAKLVKLS
jgi:hypothetical protein